MNKNNDSEVKPQKTKLFLVLINRPEEMESATESPNGIHLVGQTIRWVPFSFLSVIHPFECLRMINMEMSYRRSYEPGPLAMLASFQEMDLSDLPGSPVPGLVLTSLPQQVRDLASKWVIRCPSSTN